jgi:sulfur transfer complex TusBCD TusB component (DsrH family)
MKCAQGESYSTLVIAPVMYTLRMHIHYNLSNLNLHLITASAYRDIYLTSNTQHLIMKSIKYSQLTRENEIIVIVLPYHVESLCIIQLKPT